MRLSRPSEWSLLTRGTLAGIALVVLLAIVAVFADPPPFMRAQAASVTSETPVTVRDTDPVPSASSDPYALQKYLFQRDFQYKAEFYQGCPDHRNDKLTYMDLDRFIPCLNGSMELQMHRGKLSLVRSTDAVTIQCHVHYAGHRGQNQTVKSGWAIRHYEPQLYQPPAGANGVLPPRQPVTSLDYAFAGSITPRWTYVWTAKTGWMIYVNPDHAPFYMHTDYRIVFTWHDSARPFRDTPVPFKWSQVSKDPNYRLR